MKSLEKQICPLLLQCDFGPMGRTLVFPHLSTCKFNRLEWLRWKILFHMTSLILKTSSRLPQSLILFLNLFLQNTRIYLRLHGWLLLCNIFWVLSVCADAFQDWLQYELYLSQEIKPGVFFLQAKFVLPALVVKRSFRNSSKLLLLRSNTIPTERLSKQRAGKIEKMQMTHQHWTQLCH